ncbi:MAG: aconitase family protein, partial [Pseudomonadota bacterium]
GEVVCTTEGLSFWGGVDPATGVVIDAHHPLKGRSLTGKIVMMPTSRGSCSGSGVLLELALNGKAPAALVFSQPEEILTLGAIIAARVFDRHIAVLRLGPDAFATLARAQTAKFTGEHICADGVRLSMSAAAPAGLELSQYDQECLSGGTEDPLALAMEVIRAMAVATGASRLTDVSRGHIDGCILAHNANLVFAERMAEMGARVRIPTTINAISVDRENWAAQGTPPDFGRAASRLADAYVKMGAQPTFTCAPYLLDDPPNCGDVIGWSESNAVIFANSVLGARTAKLPDYLDLFVAMTGRAPETGVYLSENRQPRLAIACEVPCGHDDSFWPLVGWLAGRLAPNRIPVLTGLEDLRPTQDDLRALCAAFGTTSAAPMLHVAGITPETGPGPFPGAETARISRNHLADAWRSLNGGPCEVDVVAIGSPHASLREIETFCHLVNGRQRHPATEVILTVGRGVLANAQAAGWVSRLEQSGIRILPDLCWCSITEPLFPPDARSLMTNSGKFAHYAPGLNQRAVRFGSLADCAEAAVSGRVPDMPAWLGG